MAGPLYRADPQGAITVVALDGLTLLFHAPSGMTHFLAAPAPEILAALRDGPADLAALVGRLRARFDFESGGAEEAIGARLDELEEAGLVRRA